jgi:hypothetical protein
MRHARSIAATAFVMLATACKPQPCVGPARCNDFCIELGATGQIIPVLVDDAGQPLEDCDTVCAQQVGNNASGDVNVHACSFVPFDGGIAADCTWSALDCQ